MALLGCGSDDELVITEEEVTIAEYSFAPDDDQTDPDGTLHRRGTATIFPDGKTDPNFPKDGITFDAVISPVNTDKESLVTMTDTFHNVTRVFFVKGSDGAQFGMRDPDGGNVLLFSREPDGTFTADGVRVNDQFGARDVARKNPFFAATPHEVILLTYAVVKDGFVDAKTRGNPTCNPPAAQSIGCRTEPCPPGETIQFYPTTVTEALAK